MIKNRKQIRLKQYDYSQNGYYYVTICAQNRLCIFGDIINGKMIFNHTGKIVENVWKTLPTHHPVKLDVFQIMPNHVHFIIQIIDMGGSRPAPTKLGTVVGLLKSECTKQINIVGARRDAPQSTRGSPKIHVWQRNYYEHIIRNEKELFAIRRYIEENPL